MAKKDALLKELDWITEKISSQVWTLNVGALGTAWSLLIANRFSIRNTIWVFVPSLLSLLCEMAQYLSGYWLDRRLLAEMERNNRDEFHYPKLSFLYRARQFFFWCKIVLAVIAAVILVFTLVQKFT